MFNNYDQYKSNNLLKSFFVSFVFTSCLQLQALIIPVTTTFDNGTPTLGSLRAAINEANLNPHSTITFAIPMSDSGYQSATDSWLIVPPIDLPTITAPVTIDGYTENLGVNPAKPNTNSINQPNNARDPDRNSWTGCWG